MARILVIDDDPDVLSFIRMVLEEAGHEVLEASNGAEGIKVFQVQSAELVLTDIFMPEKEGLETIMELRKRFGNVKIIAMSAGSLKAQGDHLRTAGMLGAAAVLCKPFRVKLLLETVENVLTRTQRG